MKNKEEPSVDSTRGSYGSLSRPGRTAVASAEQPALSLFPESRMHPVINDANIEPACILKTLRDEFAPLRRTA